MAEQQWIQELAEVEDTATQQAFQTDAQMPQQQQSQEHPARNEEDVPTEPATSPQQVDPQAREWPVQVAPVQGRAYGPQQELECNAQEAVLAHQWVVNVEKKQSEKIESMNDRPESGKHKCLQQDIGIMASLMVHLQRSFIRQSSLSSSKGP